MGLFVLGVLVFFFIYYICSHHIHIDWKSLFKRGFQKNDNFFGLYCYTGKQGTGKTYSAIKFLIDMKLKYNYIIITNVKSFNIFSDTIYEKDINKIIDFIEAIPEKDRYIIFFDEIFTILEKQTKINKKILSFISQLRKRGIIFVTTAQEWAEINITFRRYVRFQVDCNMYGLPFSHTAFLRNAINDGSAIRWNNDLQDFVAPNISTNFSKGNRTIIESYDTFETIDTSK